MRGLVEPLNLVRELSLDELRNPSDASHAALRSLRELIRFCTEDDADLPALEHDGEPLPAHQRIVFDLCLHDIVFNVAAKLFDSTFETWTAGVTATNATEFSELHSLCTHGLRLVRQMCKGNAALGLAVARKYGGVMLHQCHLLSRVPGVDWAIPEVLEAIYCENERKYDMYCHLSLLCRPILLSAC